MTESLPPRVQDAMGRRDFRELLGKSSIARDYDPFNALPDAEQPVVRMHQTFGEWLRDLVYELDEGRLDVLRARLLEAADELDEVPLPPNGGVS